jgi:FtsP/CotA-like multicopper oxidase with cupredoxin domain
MSTSLGSETDAPQPTSPTSTSRRRLRLRLLVAILATVALLAAPAWLWMNSLVPSTYSIMSMGYADFGGGRADESHGAQHGAWEAPPAQPGDVSVTELTEPEAGPPDVAVTLAARRERLTLTSGESVDGYTLNGASPGPEIRARQGDLVEVTLVNESVADGVALHWHGVDVPNAEDGVAGVTQDAVLEGEQYVYRFVVPDVGTYWYHSHQMSHVQVIEGMFGPLVVEPVDGLPQGTVEAAALQHSYGGIRTINGSTGISRLDVPAGSRVRVRVTNTDNGPTRAWVNDVPFTVAAVDGRDVNGPTPVEGKAVLVTAGGRVDLELTMPSDGSAVRVDVGGGKAALVLGPADAASPASAETDELVDLLSYGSPAPLDLNVDDAQRTFEYNVGRRPAFVDGRPGLHWTVNGHTFPDVPMFVVDEGDVVRMTISNSSGEVHPMHLHGHHVVILSRNGVAASGSPWWVDSLDVANGNTYEVAFVADNPGIWIDHCHNLPHAQQGLVAHLAYSGVASPFVVGGDGRNHPE